MKFPEIRGWGEKEFARVSIQTGPVRRDIQSVA
jgi:hypothetical protein